jgi:16S rRNA (cytidine1402-2'-O)-methyltransferase
MNSIMSNLYIVSTPIGNLQDITLRALEILKSVDYVVCEDTRKTGNLINLLIGKENTNAKYISYFEHNEERKIPEILYLLDQGCNIALVSDSGTPLISDPGFKLVRECAMRGVNVISVPGPSSVISSIVVSGLPTDKFLYLGFLPKGKGKREKILVNLKDSLEKIPSTVIILESPHRVLETLNEIDTIFGDIFVVICRELTKIHEEVARGKISETKDYFQKSALKGEIVVLFNTNVKSM